MAQLSNELIIGIDLSDEYAQLTYYHQSVREPVTLSDPADPQHMFLDAKTFRDPDGSYHFDRLFSGLTVLTRSSVLYVMVTVRDLTEELGNQITDALCQYGIDRKRVYIQDYFSSFYYYTVNQKKDLWYQDVALIECRDEIIYGHVLHIDRSTRPAIAHVDTISRRSMGDEVRQNLGDEEWKREKDRLFFEFLKKVFEGRSISTCYLLGDYFSRDWAQKSIQYLCYKRHAYQGENLYSRGACYAAMERAGLIRSRDIIYGGNDMVTSNLGMEMSIRGKTTYYPLVNAGVNWYEAHHECQFILNHENTIRITSKPMAAGEEVLHILRLPGLPERPDRATRVRMNLYFSAPGKCHIEVEDLGFGGFYRPCQKTWKRSISV